MGAGGGIKRDNGAESAKECERRRERKGERVREGRHVCARELK